MRVLPATPETIAEGASLLRAGRLVAFPTETVYGLGANALDDAAVRRIFAAKGRPSYNPVIAHVTSADAARALVTAWPDEAERLAAAFWPGPLTLVLPKRAIVPDALTAGLAAVAVRVPAHPVALALIEAAGVPVAAPSANRYTELSPTTAAHVAKSLGDRVDLIVDGGATEVGIESTVVDLTADRPRLLRPGTIDRAALGAVLGAAPEGGAVPARGDAPRLSPGMVERHYAPRAAVSLFDGADRGGVAAQLAGLRAAGAAAGALLLTPWAGEPGPERAIRMPDDPAAYARRLYAALHTLDDAGVAAILVERPPADERWRGVRDRLERASAPGERARG
jgi:L-threonylcarbamoyladenylate synthase